VVEPAALLRETRRQKRLPVADKSDFSSNQGEHRRASSGRLLASPSEGINTEATPRGIDQIDQLQDYQKHVGPRPFAGRVVEVWLDNPVTLPPGRARLATSTAAQ
jgi:hypothetical protein